MKEGEEIIAVYTKKEDIQIIIEKFKKYSFKELKKRDHYYFSLYAKNTDEKDIIHMYPHFEKIELIMKRKRRDGRVNYDIFYEKDDGTFIVYAIHLDTIPPWLINAYPTNRNFKLFKKFVIKKYWKQ